MSNLVELTFSGGWSFLHSIRTGTFILVILMLLNLVVNVQIMKCLMKQTENPKPPPVEKPIEPEPAMMDIPYTLEIP